MEIDSSNNYCIMQNIENLTDAELKEFTRHIYADYLIVCGEKNMLNSKNIHLDLYVKEMEEQIVNAQKHTCCTIL